MPVRKEGWEVEVETEVLMQELEPELMLQEVWEVGLQGVRVVAVVYL